MHPTRIANEPTEEEIARCAYYRWLAAGRPEGTEKDDWFAAREYLLHHGGRARQEAEHVASATRIAPVIVPQAPGKRAKRQQKQA